MPNDISSQARADYQWAVQTYGAQAADKAAGGAGLARADQAGKVGSGNLDVSASGVGQIKAFFDDLAPLPQKQSEPPEVTSGQASQLESLMAQSLSGDTATFLARAMIKMFGEQRSENMLERVQDGLSAQSELLAQASNLEKEAGEMKTAALVSLVTTVVSAAVSIGMSAISTVGKMSTIGTEMKAMRQEMAASEKLIDVNHDLGTIARAEKQMPKPTSMMESMETNLTSEKKALERQVSMAKLEGKQAEKTAMLFGAVGDAGNGVAKLIGAGGEFYSKNTESDLKNIEADSKVDEAEAQYYQMQGDLAKSRADALQDMINQIITFVRDQQEAKSDRMRSITRG